MVQPSVYSRDQIVETALDLIREEGWEALSVRTIAKRMGSSTMPIYSHMGSLEELEDELRKRTKESLKEYQRQPYTEHVLLNLAFGYVVFARDEKNLFRFLFQERPQEIPLVDGKDLRESFMADFGSDSDVGQALRELREEGQDMMIQYTWVFTHGLATLVNGGALGPCSDRALMDTLKDAGEAFYTLGIQKAKRQ